jgi:AmmeMemoRadiSam system protein A
VPLDIWALDRLRGLEGFGGPPTAHDPEHSLEVELPFLQVAAPNARIVPVLLGNDTDLKLAGQLARSLRAIVDEKTIVVVSSDFTHHGENYGWTPFSGPDLPDQLLRLGRETAAVLAASEPVGFAHQVEVSGDTVCGAKPSMVLAELLQHAFDGDGEVAEVTTSGHVSGRWDLSVTSAAIVYRGAWSPWRTDETPILGEVEQGQGTRMAALARATLESYLRHDSSLASWYLDRDDDSLSRSLAGAFVTLNRKEARPGDPRRLRACMGVVEATQPLERAVVQAAVWAAQDPRFPRLKVNELEEISVEVSILSPRHRVPGPGAIEVGVHGVLLRKGTKQALFLPQVATEQGWNRRQMLDALARKAGLPADGWRNGAEFEVFTAQVFEEAH